MKAIVIAGTQSSVGKTTVSIAVMRAFRNAGMDVAPFKAGPDYIDPKFHKFITGNPSYNLDSWMLEEDTLRYLFYKNAAGRDIAVIEGVMGLFDGIGIDSSGSTAHVAKVLGAPVILVVNAAGMSASAGAMVSGYKNYDRDIDIRGVILNRVSGEGHYDLLRTVIERDTGIRCMGYLPPDNQLTLKSRHLGLVPVEELDDLEKQADALSAIVARTIDIRAIESAAEMKDAFAYHPDRIRPENTGNGLRVGLAMDEAFNFYYQANLDLMKEAGIELVEFSPAHDNSLPENIHGLYLGGGFPEVFADKLSANKTMLKDIKDNLTNGMPVYAECGGLMYLTSGIIDRDANLYPAVDFFKCKTRMTDKLQRFGYVEIEYDGIRVRGHEFHHTVIEDMHDADVKYAYTVRKPGRRESWKCGLSKNNVLAGYGHIHFYANMEFFKRIIALFLSSSRK